MQILAFSGPETGSIAASKLAMPIHRVYEMRGTMFHEIQGFSMLIAFIMLHRFVCSQWIVFF